MIRKVSIGSDYKAAMHYVLGQSVLGGNYTIHLIQVEEKVLRKQIYFQTTQNFNGVNRPIFLPLLTE